jgi:GNAT superfamily N-acetyltransferase
MITIRPARPSDVPLLFEMLRASAAHQGSPESLVVTEADLLEDGFGPHPRFQCIIAEVDEAPAGMALYFFNYSTWVSRVGLYLEDLYVDPKFRRAGVARAMLDHLWSVAREAGCRRMQWLVHRENDSAIRLYRSFGAQSADNWIFMIVQDETV